MHPAAPTATKVPNPPDAGLFNHPDPTPPEVAHLSSAVVLMAIVTTVFALVGLRLLFPKGKNRNIRGDG